MTAFSDGARAEFAASGVTRADVLAIRCRSCNSVPGALCDRSAPRVAVAGIFVAELRDLHARRFLDARTLRQAEQLKENLTKSGA